jgi:hypothetical protein
MKVRCGQKFVNNPHTKKVYLMIFFASPQYESPCQEIFPLRIFSSKNFTSGGKNLDFIFLNIHGIILHSV